MKKLLPLFLVVTLAVFMSGDTAFAKAKGKKGGFAKMDTNNDGKVSKEEFLAARKKGKPGRAEKVFAKLDTNNDGFLTKEELAAGRKNKKKKES